MRAIVTGGAGFIGSHVVDRLVDRGDDVVALDNLSSGRRENTNPRARLIVADIRDENAVEEAFDALRPEVCFHLAAQADVRVSVERPDFDADVNVLGTVRLLETARRFDAQIVFTSTGGAIYGECDRPATENSERLPLAPYGTAKLAGEEYLAMYNRLYGTRHVSLRLGNVYGPRQDPHGEAGVVAIFLGRLANGEAPHIFGDGSQTRDYVYVEDVAGANLAAAERAGGTYNVGTGSETSVLELFNACLEVAAMTVDPVFDPPRIGELARSVLDPELARQELGFHATTSLGAGLARTWDFIRSGGEKSNGSK